MLSVKVVAPQDAHIRIASLADGLTLEALVQSLLAGMAEYNGTSALAPPTVGGFNFWSGEVSHLREELIPKGWTHCDKGNFPVVVSPCETIRIACSRGSASTGDPNPNANPTTRSKKGPRTIAAIHANCHRGQAAFGFITEPKVGNTWFLLYDRQGDWLFAELSLPGSFCHIEGRPDGWVERIPLPPIFVDSARSDDSNAAPEYEVTVKRRS